MRLGIDGTIVIGEGERDEAPMLYIGEKVGSGGPKVDIALDPLEGTTICATGGPNALAVLAMADGGNLLHCPGHLHGRRSPVGPVGKGVVDIDKTPTQNLHALAEAKKCKVEDLTVIILSRPRHDALIQEVRKAGARIRLIGDGDVVGGYRHHQAGDRHRFACWASAARRKGCLAAAALRCVGGEFQGRLAPRNNEEIERAKKMGVERHQEKILHRPSWPPAMSCSPPPALPTAIICAACIFSRRRDDAIGGHAFKDQNNSGHQCDSLFRAQADLLDRRSPGTIECSETASLSGAQP